MKKFIEYIGAARTEMTHVVWPTKNEAITYSALVIVLSGLTALFATTLDAGFVKLLALIVK